jgi:hypothetical protein
MQTIDCQIIEIEPLDTTKYGVQFDTRHIELGKIKRGDKKSGRFILTNTGTEDIVIELASSCECTTVSHSYSPIKPGESSNINFVFDSTKKEESGTTDLDLYFKNVDSKTGEPIFEILQYSYELID